MLNDPAPFINGAYGIAAFLLLGFAGWLVVDRKRLRVLARALKIGDKKHG
jgi:hypothetical protein